MYNIDLDLNCWCKNPAFYVYSGSKFWSYLNYLREFCDKIV